MPIITVKWSLADDRQMVETGLLADWQVALSCVGKSLITTPILPKSW